MASVFPRWSNTAFRLAIAAVFLGGAAAVSAPMIYVRTDWNTGQNLPVQQPVQFDHRHHVQDDAIECRFCHYTVERTATAGMPSTAVCMGCHSQIWNQSLKLELVRNSYFSDTPIVWNRVNDVPDFVYFNHAIHVNKGVGCVTCHGRVDQMPEVRQVTPMTMGWCLEVPQGAGAPPPPALRDHGHGLGPRPRRGADRPADRAAARRAAPRPLLGLPQVSARGRERSDAQGIIEERPGHRRERERTRGHGRPAAERRQGGGADPTMT